MPKSNFTQTIIAAIIAGAVSGGIITLALVPKNVDAPTELTTEQRISEFYHTEVAAHVSPHGLRTKMDKNDKSFVLVDLRSQEEYETAHIIGAVNIPAYSDPNHSAYDDVERIVKSFEELGDSKRVIVYCYSTACMTGRKIGKMLSEHDIYVEHLGIGWNQWRYEWDSWNHDGETAVPSEDYVVSGSEPGTPILRDSALTPCSASEEFSC